MKAKIHQLIQIKSISLLALVIAASGFSFCSFAETSEATVKKLISNADVLNSRCRGGSGDDPNTHVACYDRDKAYSELVKIGWCWGKPGQYGYEKKWNKCEPAPNTAIGTPRKRPDGTIDPNWHRLTSTAYFIKPEAQESPVLLASIREGKISINLMDTSERICKRNETSGPNPSDPYKINGKYIQFYYFCLNGNRVFGPSTTEGKKYLLDSISNGSTKIELESGPALIFYETDFDSVREELLKTESAL